MAELLNNPHPGKILKEEFLEPLGLSQNHIAGLISVPANRIHQIVKGQRSVTADTDLRLCALFDLSDGYFLRLQDSYDLMEADRRNHKVIENIRSHVRPKFYNELSIEK